MHKMFRSLGLAVIAGGVISGAAAYFFLRSQDFLLALLARVVERPFEYRSLVAMLTGLALVNPNEEAATVTIEVFRRDGELVDSVTLQVEADNRISQLFAEIFQDFPELTGGYVRLTSDQPVFAVELFFADDAEFLATVPGQIVAN